MRGITLLETARSTNDVAMRAAKGGAEHGACWIADEQTAGRGRRDVDGARRTWHSPAGTGIYMSIVLRPELSLSEATAVPLVAAVGVRRAVEKTLGLDPWIKWPNDLYVGERKLAGILSEAYTQGMALEAIVVGVGINVNLALEDVPAELAQVLTSARIEAGRVFDRMALALAMRRHVVRALDVMSASGLGALIEELRRYDRTVGRAVEVTDGAGWVEATSRGITDEGRLSVELEDGRELVLHAGEVRFVRE